MSREKAFSYQLLNLKELWEEVDIIKTVADDFSFKQQLGMGFKLFLGSLCEWRRDYFNFRTPTAGLRM